MDLTTERGVYLSTNYGDSFQMIASDATMASAFDTDEGSKLYYGADYLVQYDLEDGTTTELNLPALSDGEVIISIAVNPVDDKLAVATVERDIYIGTSGAWRPIATDGYSS